MNVVHVVGARPNFMKAAPVIRAIGQHAGIKQLLVHTGQHYDRQMSDVFFTQLEIPEPDVNLQVGSGTHAQQTAAIMVGLEQIFTERKPDLVVVYGDVNSTVAAALVSAKMLIPLAHVEAGLRSYDRTMPEEINRLLTDQIADMLFTPSVDGDANLKREGVSADKIHFVGNVMIDTLVRLLPKALSTAVEIPQRPYALVTLHRAGNVDDLQFLAGMLRALEDISKELMIVFPVHPRTQKRINEFGIDSAHGSRLKFMEPLPYLEFLALQKHAAIVITDSGGIQEETTYLGIPCLTVRDNTERPITCEIGTNTLVGTDIGRLRTAVENFSKGEPKKGSIPELWDGHASDRIAKIIAEKLASKAKHASRA